MIPDIEVPKIPEDPVYSEICSNPIILIQFLMQRNRDRTKQYQAEFEGLESIDDYLISLDMIAEAKPFEPIRYASTYPEICLMLENDGIQKQ